MRDLLISMQAEHGGIYVSTPASTSIAVAGTAVKAAGTTTLFGASANKWDMSTNNRLRYIGTPTRSCAINASVSLSLNTAVADKLLSAQLFVDGVLVPGAINTGFAGATTVKEVNINVNAIISLATNSYVEVWVTNEDSTDNITMQKLTMTATSMVA